MTTLSPRRGAPPPWTWPLAGLLSLTPFAIPTAVAQDAAPEPGSSSEIDDEAARLRAEAEAELAGEGPGEAPKSDEERLRSLAAAEVEDSSPLYQNLLDAFSSIANRMNSFNPRLTVFGDFLGRLSAGSHELVEDGRNVDDRVALREVELDLRADIDPYAKGVLILSIEEQGGGAYEVGVEEGYLTLETLPWGFRAQLGRFRVPFGRINALHVHDLPQAEYPWMLRDLFGEDGYIEQGALLTWLAPFAPLELTAGFLNGENERAFAGGNSDDPAWLARAEFFQPFGDTMFLSLGASGLFGYNDAPSPVDKKGKPRQETQLAGADLLFKWQPNQFQSLVVQAELFGLRKELGNGSRDYAFGGYAQFLVQPLQRWYFGGRYDFSDYDEAREDTDQWAASAWVSYYTTEFLRFRLGYEHRERKSTGGGDPDLDTVFFQVTFVFGSHPAEPFWVNR